MPLPNPIDFLTPQKAIKCMSGAEIDAEVDKLLTLWRTTDHDAAYQDGFEDGYADAEEDGYTEAYEAGYQEGFGDAKASEARE